MRCFRRCTTTLHPNRQRDLQTVLRSQTPTLVFSPSHSPTSSAWIPCTSLFSRVQCSIDRIDHAEVHRRRTPMRIPLDLPKAILDTRGFVQKTAEFHNSVIRDELHAERVRKTIWS